MLKTLGERLENLITESTLALFLFIILVAFGFSAVLLGSAYALTQVLGF